LGQTIADLLRDRVTHLRLRIPAAEGRLLAALHANGKVLSQKVSGRHLRIEALVAAAFAGTLDPKWIES
jgi:50S ribosomal subunit-associated GTPase HflX